MASYKDPLKLHTFARSLSLRSLASFKVNEASYFIRNSNGQAQAPHLPSKSVPADSPPPRLLLSFPPYSSDSQLASAPLVTLHQSIRKCTFKVLSKAETLRTGLVLVASISALLNAGLCVVEYYGVIGKGGEMRVKVGLLGMEVVISIAEIVCIVVYWNMVVKIGDTRNAALSVQYVANASLLQARCTLAICIFKCICHLFIPIPVLQVNTLVRLFGIDMAAD